MYQTDTHLDTREVTWGSDPLSGRSEPADFAEFAARALAATAANLGGIETLLAGRPGSREADHLRTLLTGTVGADEENLWAHRTEPLVIHIPVDEILTDLGAWDAYEDAHRDLDHAEKALNIPSRPGQLILEPTPDQEATLDRIDQARDRLHQQREHAWADYGRAFKHAVLAELQRQPIAGLTVPVEVQVSTDPATTRATWHTAALTPQLARLFDAGHRNTPLPTLELERIATLTRDPSARHDGDRRPHSLVREPAAGREAASEASGRARRPSNGFAR